MKNKFTRITAILMALCAVLLIVGCGSKAETPVASPQEEAAAPVQGEAPAASSQEEAPAAAGKERKIAVALASTSSADIMLKDYYENTIGPAFNTKFVFSEALGDTESVIAFLESAYAAGCEGVVVYPTDGLEQIIAKANELGMYLVSNAARIQDDVKDLPYYIGNVSSGPALTAASYRSIIEKILSDGEKHNVVIVSGGAGMGSTQHNLVTRAVLESLQDAYSLTYTDTIENLAKTTSQIEVETGTDTRIVIYPGFASSDSYVPGMSNILQTGEYDIVICAYNVFSQFSVAINEVEKAYGKNIQVVTLASVDDNTANAFNTKDAFDNPSIDAVVVKPLCAMGAEMFILLYNAMEGNLEQIRETAGEASMYIMPMWYAYGYDEYMELSTLDNSPETYAFQPEDIKSMLVSVNDSVNFQTIYDTFYNCTAQSLINK